MLKSLQLKILLGDIRFWIIFFFVIRLVGITNPPLESSHNWRQTDVTMVARNFLEIDNNIFYPRIDIAGNKSGITGMEFPLLNYLIYLVSLVFGYEHWYGRLINLVFSSIGLFYFFKLIRKYFNKKTAFNATLILTTSIWFAFSRKIMPDTFSMSFIIISIYYGSNYFDTHKFQFKNILIYTILLCIGVSTKLPSGFLIIVFGIFIFNKKFSLKKKIIFISSTFICLLPPLIWYFYWVPHLVKTYEVWHFFMGKSMLEGLQDINSNLPLTIKRFYDDALKYIGFMVFIFGIYHAFKKKKLLLISIFISCSALFIIIMLKAGSGFVDHNYYIIPFVPIMSLVAGYGISNIRNNKVAIIFLLAICLEGIFNQQHDFWIIKDKLTILNLEKDMNKFSKQTDLIIINSDSHPSPMYFAHRKGWSANNENITNTHYINKLKSKGLKFIVIINNTVHLDYTIVLKNENYCIYSLE